MQDHFPKKNDDVIYNIFSNFLISRVVLMDSNTISPKQSLAEHGVCCPVIPEFNGDFHAVFLHQGYGYSE